MSLPQINLDDRTFSEMVDEAVSRVSQTCPQWNDFSSGDPGRMLVELFAYLTDTMIYRINRLPQKAFVEFLRLLGVKLLPPSAAATTVVFSLPSPAQKDILIPRYTRVASMRGSGDSEPPVFVTARNGRIKEGDTECTVDAFNAEIVEGELVGYGTGSPGLSVRVARAPIVSGRECLVGVETPASELDERVESLTFQKKVYRVFREVDTFADTGPDVPVYTLDRMAGTVTFAPALHSADSNGNLKPVPEALGEVIKKGREIRVWYARGGGIEGNVDKEMLTLLKDPVAKVHLTVTNPHPATGGAPGETVENALKRGPYHFKSLQRAVTADDFELITQKVTGSTSRAHAYTKHTVWKHALRGTVEVLVVPSVDEKTWNNGRISVHTLQQLQTQKALDDIKNELVKRASLGITVLVDWVKYKAVKVSARIVVTEGENVDAVKKRVLDRLYNTINPIPNSYSHSGWQYNTPLRLSHIYDSILAEPGVRYADSVRLIVESAPDKDVTCIRPDSFQKGMWYASSGNRLFRTTNDGMGWEQMYSFGETEEIIRIECHAGVPGHIAVCTVFPENGKKVSRLYYASDCGESRSWHLVHQMAFEVEDIAWTERDNKPALLIAAINGLYELTLGENPIPGKIIVDRNNADMGFYAVNAASDNRGASYVAVAAQKNQGVYLSDLQGRENTYFALGLENHDIRLLEMHMLNGRLFLWAGERAAGSETGKGCFRTELRGASTSSDTWTHFGSKWSGGSCLSLSFRDETAIAGTHHGGVLKLDARKSDAEWQSHSVNNGLPFRSRERIFEPVETLSHAQSSTEPLLLAGGPRGVYRGKDIKRFEYCSQTEFTERVTVPPTWLISSGEHTIEVVSENEAE